VSRSEKSMVNDVASHLCAKNEYKDPDIDCSVHCLYSDMNRIYLLLILSRFCKAARRTWYCLDAGEGKNARVLKLKFFHVLPS
jgi:hypothetical protein